MHFFIMRSIFRLSNRPFPLLIIGYSFGIRSNAGGVKKHI